MPIGKTSIRWVLVGWMFLVSAIAYLDRVNISIAGPSIAEEFHLTNIELGGVFSAFVLGYAFFQAPGGWLSDRLGARRVLMLGVIWWGLFTAAVTLVTPNVAGPLTILIVLRLLLGMGEAVVYPATNCIVAAWIPSSERGVANGIIFAGVGFGAGITPPIISWFLAHYGWRSSFWASAVLGLLAGAIWYAIARDTPDAHPWVSKEEKAFIASGLPQRDPATKTRAGLRSIVTNRDLQAITFSYFCYGYTAYIFFTWFFIYLNKVRGLNLKQSTYYSMLPFIAMAVGSALGGWISDMVSRKLGTRAGRCVFASIAMLLAAAFVALGTSVESAQLATFFLAGGAGALYLSQSSFWSLSADIGKSAAGSVSSLMNMGGQLGGALTASLTPAIAEKFGWTASFLAAAALCGCGGLAWLLVLPKAKTASTPGISSQDSSPTTLI
jgi:ACS family glucarate transporter-like MFS transporter